MRDELSFQSGRLKMRLMLWALARLDKTMEREQAQLMDDPAVENEEQAEFLATMNTVTRWSLALGMALGLLAALFVVGAVTLAHLAPDWLFFGVTFTVVGIWVIRGAASAWKWLKGRRRATG